MLIAEPETPHKLLLNSHYPSYQY